MIITASGIISRLQFFEENNMMTKNKNMKNILSFIYMTLGTVLLTAGVYFFKIPNGFVTGGVSGIGTVFGKILSFLSAAQWISVINMLLLIVGFIFIGKDTGIKTVYCSLLFSGLTVVFEVITPVLSPLTDQPFMELVYAILLTSVGSALIFEQGASSGGTDIIALILKKYTSINVGQALLYTDFLVCVSSFFVFGIKAGLFSLLGLFAKAFLVDSVIDIINSCKYFIVITDKPDEVKTYVMNELHHGVSSNKVTGEYSGKERTMLHTVCRRIEAIRLRKKVMEIDNHAFVIITTTSEIVGRGFRAV